jgi:hypothetical protein
MASGAFLGADFSTIDPRPTDRSTPKTFDLCHARSSIVQKNACVWLENPFPRPNMNERHKKRP